MSSPTATEVNETAPCALVEAEPLVEAEARPLTATESENEVTWVEGEPLVLAEAEPVEIAAPPEPVPPPATPEHISRRGVSFTTVEVKEYAIIPGVNPAVSTGVPLTIDWNPLNENKYDLEHYELAVEGARRNIIEMHMPAKRRKEVLREWGVSKAEIREVIKATNVARKQRQQTNKLYQYSLPPVTNSLASSGRNDLDATRYPIAIW